MTDISIGGFFLQILGTIVVVAAVYAVVQAIKAKRAPKREDDETFDSGLR